MTSGEILIPPSPCHLLIVGVAPNKWINLTCYSGLFWNGCAFSFQKSPL